MTEGVNKDNIYLVIVTFHVKSNQKHKLFEKISPKKTIEGFIGGVLFSIIAAIIIHKYFCDVNKVQTNFTRLDRISLINVF